MTDPYTQEPPPPGSFPTYVPQPGTGPLGRPRGTGFAILMCFLTCGLYSYYWWYSVHEEMKRHRGEGLGGGLALLVAIVFSPAMAFITSDEVGKLYSSRGSEPPVTWQTALWYFPGMFILVGPIVWFLKTNRALNEYWVALGAPAQ